MHPKLIKFVPAQILVPDNARPSARTVLTHCTKLCTFSSKPSLDTDDFEYFVHQVALFKTNEESLVRSFDISNRWLSL